MSVKHEHKKFYMCDYFLDGNFLNSKETLGEDLPRTGESKVISLKPGVDINVKIVGTEQISEDEYRILMDSSN